MHKIQLSEGNGMSGTANARNIKRAHMLLKSAEGWTNERIAATLEAVWRR